MSNLYWTTKTGVVMNVDDMDDCVEVLCYAGGFNIQVLDEGDYLYEVFDNQESDEMHTRVKSKEIKDIISFIWRFEADKLFNKSK
ncbi:MAG: hypothetical protein EBU52_13170 [Cytophagia bacterium]|nr:hypothetical protein [Cytophagia bacterium]